MKKKITVDVSDICFSKDPEEVLIAPSLGSCVSVSLYDVHQKAGGILIFMLPKASEMEFGRSGNFKFMFGDTGIPAFFEEAEAFGLSLKDCKVVVVGGGEIMGQKGGINIGHKNCIVVDQFVEKMGIDPIHKSMGGHLNRTLSLKIENGFFTIDVKGRGAEEYEL